jgi:hypothetical protein
MTGGADGSMTLAFDVSVGGALITSNSGMDENEDV